MPIASHLEDDLIERADSIDDAEAAAREHAANAALIKRDLSERPGRNHELRLARELFRQGEALRLAGHADEALGPANEALAVYEHVGSTRAAFLQRGRIALCVRHAGRPAEAHAALTALLERASEPGFEAFTDQLLEWRALCAFDLGDQASARTDLEEAIAIRRGRRGDATSLSQLLALMEGSQ